MESYKKTFKKIDKGFINKLNTELKISYLLTDIIFKNGIKNINA